MGFVDKNLFIQGTKTTLNIISGEIINMKTNLACPIIYLYFELKIT